jgi:hypothetical protein
MLVIKNIETTKSKEFHWEGKAWVLYGIDTTSLEYRFIFMPKDSIADVYITQKAQLVLLDRNKKRIGSKVLGYRLWTTDGKHTYLNTKDIPNWSALVKKVYENRMVSNNNIK